MTDIQNILFIMADQLRADHLACYGHPYIKTPNLDALAKKGVRFTRAFVNSGVCGPSRMSYYTGRYPSTHGATWNRVPLSIGEITIGEYLREHGLDLVLAGKTHVLPDSEGLARLQIDGGSELGYLLKRGGFTEIDRYDGHHEPGEESGYPAYLRSKGYISKDPWTDFVISAINEKKEKVSGWYMRNAKYPAAVKEEHSETAYMTNQALKYISKKRDNPWVMHLSYVKPHWPYIAPAPYHAMYAPDQCLPVVREQKEKENAHPVLQAYRQQEESISFSLDECIRTVRPAYQGLITQLDHHIGRLIEHLDKKNILNKTLIIFTSDHGDLLGDHWLGEKELFYDAVQQVPLIIVDPRKSADKTRGIAITEMVQAVDILPTILEALNLPIPEHRLEGRSLIPLINNTYDSWDNTVYSELDYSYRKARLILNRTPENSRAWAIRNEKWYYVYWMDLPEQLFDLENDPLQLQDLGCSPSYEGVREQFRQQLLEWFSRLKRRATVSYTQVKEGTDAYKQAGVFYGQW